MDTSKKYKWALTGLIVMILLNAATLFTIWLNKPDVRPWRGAHHNYREHRSVQDVMKNRLGLTNIQSDSIQHLRKEHYREMRSYRDTLDTYRQAYLEFVMSNETDNSQRDSLLTLITGQYREIERSMYRHMAEIKNVLDEEQRQKFESFLKTTFFNDNSKRERRK